ncbi:MAG: VanZ family protein [Gemmatimonadales bacterium]|nr:MAG: VanZ family protein [Gemmatimonadales bacterium]
MPLSQRRLGYRLATAGLLFIGLLTLFPHPSETARVAATPIGCLVCGDLGGVDVFLNILLFLPLGIGLGLAGFSWRRAILLAGLLSFGIELLQMKVVAGRDASLSDLITNTTGGGLGAILGVYWRRLVYPPPVPARLLALFCAVSLTGIWAGTAWAFGPTWPVGAPWYGQWAPDLGGSFKPFLGRVLAVEAGGEPLLPGRAIDEERLEDAVAANPSMAFRAVLGPQPTRLAPVGAIYDDWQRQVVLLGQERQDLTFHVRMRATLLRLWNPMVNLRDGMDGQPGDTVEAAGMLRAGVYELSSRIGGRVRTRTLPLSASWGWSLVTPWDSVLGEEVHSLTALWIIGLVALLAYWSVLAGGATLAIVPATAAVLFAAVPYAAGFPPAHWSEWVAALVGTGFGAIAGIAALRKSRSQVDRDEA